jgi:GTP-binding protein
MDIRNIAIIAHVDHGKTTLVDGMLKQTHTFRDNQAEMNQTTILDSGELEREKGITILAKNTAIIYKNTKINIIDTPGHADFSGEVERVINMVDGALLIIDAAEGPLSQTEFVLEKALEHNLKIIVVINKIDRKDARPKEVLTETEELILRLAKKDQHLEFAVLYSIGKDGKAWEVYPEQINTPADLSPLLEKILSYIPAPTNNSEKTFKMLVSTLDFDNYKGTYAIGKITQGSIKPGQRVILSSYKDILGSYKILNVFTSVGLTRVEVPEAQSGDIVAVTGISEVNIGQTLSDPSDPIGYPLIKIGEPTLKITISPNSSPLSGKEGKFSTARLLQQRLMKEKKTNIGLLIDDHGSSGFELSGRGELHLSILLETLRREGYEMQIGKPKVIYQEIDGKTFEPFEEVTIEVSKEFVGMLLGELGRRKSTIIDVRNYDNGATRFLLTISSRNLMGLRGSLISQTGGRCIFASRFIGYKPLIDYVPKLRNGALIAFENGVSTAYALEKVQERGTAFIGPGEPVYEGMIIGLNNREEDMDINVCKSKKLTNMHTENSDVAIQLDPPVRLTLEQCLDFIEDDELLEITPKSLRLRKYHLKKIDRIRASRTQK